MNKFKDRLTEDIALGHRVKGLSPDIIRKAMIKIILLNLELNFLFIRHTSPLYNNT